MPTGPRRRLDRADVLARVSLAEVLTAELGHPRRSGGEPWWPSVDPALPGTGKSPPTHIAGTDSNGIEHFKDFASGRSGTAVDVLMITRGLPFADALRLLAAQAGVVPGRALPPAPARPVAPPRPQGGPPSAEFAEWIDGCAERLWQDHTLAAEARAWLTGRGYGEEMLRDNRIGYDPGAARDSRWPKERRVAHGIPGIAGITIPMYDRNGCLTYAQTRNLRWTPDSRWPKYVNPTRIVTNPALAYWADPGRYAGRPVIVVEGPTDALAARQAGHDVAALIGAGHAANPVVAAKLVEAFGTDRPYVIMTDPDPAGRLAGQQLAAHLSAVGAVVVHQPSEVDDDLAGQLQRDSERFAGLLAELIDVALVELSGSARHALQQELGLRRVETVCGLSDQVTALTRVRLAQPPVGRDQW